MFKFILFFMYILGLYLTWNIVESNIEVCKTEKMSKGEPFKVNYPRELLIGLVIWIFSPAWMISFIIWEVFRKLRMKF